MAIDTPWGTNWDDSPPTHDDLTSRPTLVDDTVPGALDGDRFHVSHLNALRDKQDLIAQLTGLPLLWQWNGTDLTQFGTKVEGAAIDDSEVAAVSYFGKTVVRIRAEGGSTPDGEYAENMVIVPLTVPNLPTNYFVVADFLQGALDSDGAVLGVRMGTSSTPSLVDGYVLMQRRAQANWDLGLTEVGPAYTSIATIEGIGAGDQGGLRIGLGVEAASILHSSVVSSHFNTHDASKGGDHDQGFPCIGLIGNPGSDWSGAWTTLWFFNIKVYAMPRGGLEGV